MTAVPPTDRRLSLASDAAGLALLFLLAVIVSAPWGDFPINDDWSWAIATRRLALEHVWHPTGWTSMTLFTHAAWGALFCWASGSCTDGTLRWATIAAGVIGVFASYFLAWQAGLPRSRRLLYSGMLAASPLYFGLAVTYMTDVTFLAMIAVAAIFWVRAIRTGSQTAVVIATAVTVVAVLNRQMAVILPFGYLAAVVFGGRPNVRKIAIAAVPLAVTAAALMLFNRWMDGLGVTPAMYHGPGSALVETLTSPRELTKHLIRYGITVPFYVGLFCLPILIAQGKPQVSAPLFLRRAAFGAGAAFAVLALAACIIHYGPMPIGMNILTPVGLGPHSIYPYGLPDFFGPEYGAPAAAAWWFITVLSAVGGGLVIERLLLTTAAVLGLTEVPFEAPTRSLEAFFLAAILAYCAPMVVAGFYDRYLLPLLLLAPLMGAALPSTARPRWAFPAAFAVVGLFGLISIAWVHDQMSWNRARWDAIARLQDQGVPASQLDGGFEFNGPRCFDPVEICSGGQWGAILDPVYLVSFERAPGYRELFSIPYATWLPPKRFEILVLQRVSARPASGAGKP